MSSLRLIFLLATLAIPFNALPAGAQDTPTSSLAAGSITLPEASILPDDATILVSVDDTSRADAAAATLSRLVMQSPGAASTISFALSVLPVALEAHPVLGPLDITVLVCIESTDGTLLFINDTAIAAVDAEGPTGDLVAPVAAVES